MEAVAAEVAEVVAAAVVVDVPAAVTKSSEPLSC